MTSLNEFVQTLQSKLSTSQPCFGDDADSVLGFLCNAYYDQNCNSDSGRLSKHLRNFMKP